MEGVRGPGQRAGLSRNRVVAAARELLANGGVAALTMRGLAEHLGVSPNALYSHVSGKSELVDDVLDDVLAGVQAPAPDVDNPSDGLHALMTSTYEVLLANPELVSLYVERGGARGENAQALGRVMLLLLERIGVRGVDALKARRVLIIYTVGFAAFAVRPPFEDRADAKPRDKEMWTSFSNGLGWLLAGVKGIHRAPQGGLTD